MLLAGIIAVGISIAIIACLLEYGISNIVFTGTVALYGLPLSDSPEYRHSLPRSLLGILWQAITTIAEAWVVVMGADSWVKTSTFDDLPWYRVPLPLRMYPTH